MIYKAEMIVWLLKPDRFYGDDISINEQMVKLHSTLAAITCSH